MAQAWGWTTSLVSMMMRSRSVSGRITASAFPRELRPLYASAHRQGWARYTVVTTIKKLSRLACHKDFHERLEYLQTLGFFRCIHHTDLVLDESHGNESLVRRTILVPRSTVTPNLVALVLNSWQSRNWPTCMRMRDVELHGPERSADNDARVRVNAVHTHMSVHLR